MFNHRVLANQIYEAHFVSLLLRDVSAHSAAGFTVCRVCNFLVAYHKEFWFCSPPPMLQRQSSSGSVGPLDIQKLPQGHISWVYSLSIKGLNLNLPDEGQ